MFWRDSRRLALCTGATIRGCCQRSSFAVNGTTNVVRAENTSYRTSAGLLYEEIAPNMSQVIEHKVAVSPQLPGVSVSFNAQSFGGFEIVVYSTAGNEPSELYSGLRAIGFTSREPSARVDGVRQTF